MKTQFARMLQNFHSSGYYRHTELQLKKLASHNLQLEREIREKENEVAKLNKLISEQEVRIQDLVGTDVLTGLPNRHSFEEHLIRSLKRFSRLGYSLSLMMIDVDHLNEINLLYGYEVGDSVLVEIAKILRSSVREIDMPARWGGEELVAVLHETDADAAAVVAERVRRRIAMLDITDPNSGKSFKTTASLAVASCPLHGNEFELLFESVRHALISAKEKGCNQVMIAERLPH